MRVFLLSLLLSQAALAAPGQFTHQGRLLDAEGMPLEDDVTITFRLTTAETGGDVLWEEPLTVSLNHGFYSAILGADEEGNPLDIEVLSQAPVWLELQLDGEDAMSPRSPVHSVPYAAMATVAEEVAGGPVDAETVAVGGIPVINEAGEWVGPASSVSWSDIEGMPEDFADGVDDDTHSDSLADLATSCLDGDIPVWDGVVEAWACDVDQDTLASISCLDGQIIHWSGDSMGWICADDVDTFLTEEDVDSMVADNGYAMTSEVFSGSFSDLADVPAGLEDGDNDTQLSEAEVDEMVSDNGYAMGTDVFSGSFGDLAGVPAGLDDGDNDTLQDLTCTVGQIAVQTEDGWACSSFAAELDHDEDGSMVWSDCDDRDASKGDRSLDADCDGAIGPADCNDDDASSTTVAMDGDCDGILTEEDCDDADSELGTVGDCDGDGVSEAMDCDDEDASSTTIALDADCDGIETAEDCDDEDASSSTWGTADCPATSCKALLDLAPSLGNGTFTIQPSGTTTSHTFFCDLEGTYTTPGSLFLVTHYGSYSARALSSCGAPVDADCSPDASHPTPYYYGALTERVQFDWRDADDLPVADEFLEMMNEEIGTIDLTGVRHYAYDADYIDHFKIQFVYVDGSSNSLDYNGSNWGGPSSWVEWTSEGHNMMIGGQYNTPPSTSKIPRSFNVDQGVTANWGWHIRFTSAVMGERGIWLH